MRGTLLLKRVREMVKPIDVAIQESDTIEMTMQALWKKDVGHKIIYFYVVDDQNRLVGVLSTRKLLLADPSCLISDIMNRSIVYISGDKTMQAAMEIFARHNLLALPAIDEEGKLLGMIDVEMYMDQPFDIADARHRADIFQLIGISLEEKSFWGNYCLRMPWIFCNMLGGILCAIISMFHEQVLGKILLFAMFIPLVLTLSESVSMQSMAYSLQFLRRPKGKLKNLYFSALREGKVIGVIAITCAVIVGLLSLLWGDGTFPSFTIGMSIVLSVSASAGFGFLFPIFLHRIKLDPKVASGPVVLMFADVLTITFYLSLASWWLL